MRLSHGTGSQSTLTQTAGTINATGDMIVGDVAQGFYNPSGGTTNIAGKLVLGNSVGSNGSVTESGSAIINVGTSTVSSPWVDIGSTGTGTYTINGGYLIAYTSTGFNVGDMSTSSGTLNVNGGTIFARPLRRQTQHCPGYCYSNRRNLQCNAIRRRGRSHRRIRLLQR